MKTKTKISGYILRGSAAALLLLCVVVALCSAFNLPNDPPKVQTLQNNTTSGVSGHEGASSVAASAIQRNRTLTFADRIAYQRAIEEVYWRHRIWPAANADPKPPLDKVMSRAEIENKVEDYLRNSQALEDYWQKPITPDQLQAEMERIASHTKQPEVLHEIFGVLGNDPFVIAECLAKPILAERLLTELYAHDQRFHGELKRHAEAELRTHQSVSQMKQTNGMYTEVEMVTSDSDHDKHTGGSASPEDDGKANRRSGGTEPSIRMNSSEWQERLARLAARFGSQDIVGQAPRLPNGRLAAGAADLQQADAHISTAGPDAWAQIKTSISACYRKTTHYYAVTVMNKGKNRLKLATIAWLKEPLRSWVAKAETQVPVTMAAVSANYTLPVIASPSVECTDDTWTPTGSPTRRRPSRSHGSSLDRQ